MRILMTTDTLGGVWTFTQELAKGLLRRSCAVCLVSLGRRPSAAQQDWCDQMQSLWPEDFRFEVLDIPLEWMENNEQAYEGAARILTDLADKFIADLVHSNQFCFGALPLEIPKVITAHSDVFSWADCCRNGPLEESDWLQQYRSLVSEGLTKADTIVTPTHWMAQALARNFALLQEPVTIPNGRSTLNKSTGPRKLQAVTAGRLWDEAKNILMLRDVQSLIPIFVAGEQHLGSSPKISTVGSAMLIGTLTEHELLNLFCESAIYICTSRYEPFGLAPLEAALCGCAVLAHDISSLREVWQNDALYFSDATTLSTLLHQLFNRPDQLLAARQRSVNRAQQFTAERMTEDYYRIFQQTIARSKAVAYA
jgi:glycosyltransferase involved in cell wall biosynthesis